jgi:hypothetical protein
MTTTMKNALFAPPCFSSQCGLCASCHTHEEPLRANARLDRVRLLAKFSKDSNGVEVETYRNQMTQLMYREANGLCKPSECVHGILAPSYTVDESLYHTSVYTRIANPHTQICDNVPCMRSYLESPDYFHNSWFPTIPMYERGDLPKTKKDDSSCHLCGLCMKTQGQPQRVVDSLISRTVTE